LNCNIKIKRTHRTGSTASNSLTRCIWFSFSSALQSRCTQCTAQLWCRLLWLCSSLLSRT